MSLFVLWMWVDFSLQGVNAVSCFTQSVHLNSYYQQQIINICCWCTDLIHHHHSFACPELSVDIDSKEFFRDYVVYFCFISVSRRFYLTVLIVKTEAITLPCTQ